MLQLQKRGPAGSNPFSLTPLHTTTPTVICPYIPSPQYLGPPTFTRLPPHPSRAWMSSDLERHPHLPRAEALWRTAELSQSPCGGQPSVLLFLCFSHHLAKTHGSYMRARLITPAPPPPKVARVPASEIISGETLTFQGRPFHSRGLLGLHF